MSFVRSIGRFGLAALIVNSIIGSGIFGIPTELIRAVGRASPIAMVCSGLLAAVIMACFAEVASQFSEPGGSYLYTRTALGTFAGAQSGWFLWICFLTAAAANANLFVIYLSGIVPLAERGDFPAFFARIHDRFRTPHVSIVIFSALLVLLAITGSFRWAVAVGSGALLINYGLVCVSLIRLRKLRPNADALRIPLARLLAIIGILGSLTLLSTLQFREALLLGVTAIIATVNWWVVSRRGNSPEASASAAD